MAYKSCRDTTDLEMGRHEIMGPGTRTDKAMYKGNKKKKKKTQGPREDMARKDLR